MKRSLIDIIEGRVPLREETNQKYQFYKDEHDNDPVEIDAKDEDDAMDQIKTITKKDPKKIEHWRVTKRDEKQVDESDDEFDDEDESEPDEPDPYDAFIADGRGSNYSVSINRKHLGDAEDYDEATDMLVKWMNTNKYYPTVWMVSDHGNHEVDSTFPWDRVKMSEGRSVRETESDPIDYEEGTVIAAHLREGTDYVCIMGDESLLVTYVSRSKSQPVLNFTYKHDGSRLHLSPYDVKRYIKKQKSSVKEENTTSNLDGGLGQPQTPFAFQRKKPSRADLTKKRKNATSSTGYKIDDDERSPYTKKMESMYREVGKVIGESMSRGVPMLGKMFDQKLPIPEVRSTATPGEWVVYVEDENYKKTVVKVAPSYRVAKAILDKVKNDPKYDKYNSWGMTNKSDWEQEEGPVNEAKYSDWASDPASSPREKINKSIQEVSRKLYEIESMVNRVSKLKTESGLDQDVFWKQTMNRFGKISERLLRVGTKLRELNK